MSWEIKSQAHRNKSNFKLNTSHFIYIDRGEGGGGGLQGNPWYSPPARMTSSLASVTFKMASKVFIEETEIPVRFLGFGDFKVSIVKEN